jgi:hypothetical protein
MGSTVDLAYGDNNRGRTYGSGSKETFESGAILSLDVPACLEINDVALSSSATELNTLDGVATTWPTMIPGTHDITVGEEGSDTINVAVQLKDITGTAIAASKLVKVYLSDSSTGDGLCATAPDTDVAIGTDGTIITEHVADKMFEIWTESDGQFDLDIGESGADTWYLVISDGFNLQVSDAITFAV